MRKVKFAVAAGLLVVGSMMFSSAAQAQVIVAPTVYGPPMVGRPVVRASVVAPVPVVRPVVTTYSSTTYASSLPVTTYSRFYVARRPVIVAPRVRPVVPFQPVRNAIRIRRPF